MDERSAERLHVAAERLAAAQNIWLASVRAPGAARPAPEGRALEDRALEDRAPESQGLGRPHLVPLWFVWLPGRNRLYVCTEANSVKARNMQRNPYVVLALEDGSRPLIIEGAAQRVESRPAAVVLAFREKYDWDIRHSETYNTLFAIEPQKVLAWE